MGKNSDANVCVRCSSSLGEKAKSQPQRVDDGCGHYENYCSRCFVWSRANEINEQGTHGHPRFEANQMCAAKCQFCEWTAVSFGAQPGRQLRCGHCGKPGAIRVPIGANAFTKLELEAIRDAQHEASKAL